MQILLPVSIRCYNLACMKLLNGNELAGYIKERQARDVRYIWSTRHLKPKLAILQCKDDPVINTYVRLKKKYGSDIGIDVDSHFVEQKTLASLITELNTDVTVNGIIVQLPLEDASQTEELVNIVAPEKDVDALGVNAKFEPATPMAILWLLAGYNIKLEGRRVLLIGRGKLVGGPLEKIFRKSKVDSETIDRGAKDLSTHTLKADVIITATGSPAILYPSMIKQGAVVVDAGVASESGKLVGDLSEEVYSRDDLTVTPVKGGVGPLTVCALFENVIRAARAKVDPTS